MYSYIFFTTREGGKGRGDSPQKKKREERAERIVRFSCFELWNRGEKRRKLNNRGGSSKLGKKVIYSFLTWRGREEGGKKNAACLLQEEERKRGY